MQEEVQSSELDSEDVQSEEEQPVVAQKEPGVSAGKLNLRSLTSNDLVQLMRADYKKYGKDWTSKKVRGGPP